ncbi:MAG: hypothetical protein LBF40_02245 [Deltaproteobacteria bacterium]|jgi:hypothetical protein|nr:hypothetical protein [Deltaproteobacteria bacterium]
MLKFQKQTPRQVEIIREQLGDLNGILDSINYEVEYDSNSMIYINSMKSQREDLEEELKASEWLEKPYAMELSMSGPRSVPTGCLGKILGKVRELLLAAAVIASGTDRKGVRSTAKLHKAWEGRRLLAESLEPSSFAIRLSYANDGRMPLVMETDPDTAPEKDDSIENMFLTLLSGETDEECASALVLSPGLRGLYRDFLGMLAEHGVGLSLRTKAHPYAVGMSPQKARKRKESLGRISYQKKDKEIEVEGVLVMGDIRNGSFAIEGDSGVYRGKASEGGLEGLGKFALGKRVRARLLSSTPGGGSGVPSYSLLSLRGLS